ncbi:dehydrogenase [Desulfosarcina ovata subsp. sediminis]|uniref:Dehydrogenase n=1 Tax=Desulfosarcina ovata subsp. sediminis TaxID=885957 RepID=A0A5K7ZLV3_9BACT|nr:molybdopterin-dependent oxidoreductase [Desulfosarcina ovata]BBO82106.1 dehydrogenase [Desulfosarcina ovata subsp. sediminis]
MKARKEILTDCTLCYHSCGIKVAVEDGKAVEVKGLASHPINKGELCPKGENILDTIYHPQRIKYPMKKVNGKFERISWETALDEISQKLSDLKEKFGPQMMGMFSGSIGVENMEIAGLTQRFKTAFGSPNFFSVESVCYRMRIRTRQITFGKYPTEELDSKLYILWGHNPDASDLPLKMAIEKNMQKGAKVVVIDPKKIPMSKNADMVLTIRPGSDGALALALIHVIIQEKLYDRDFIDKHTKGFEKLVPHIEPFTPEWAQKITWVPADKIRELARLFAATKGAAIYQGTCTQDQTANGTQNSRAFSILQVITGNINVPGGWVISPRPYLGNVGLAGDGDPLGIDKYPLFIELWGRKSPYGVVTMVPENIPDLLKSFIVVGGNPLVSMPDSNAFKEAFRKLDLLVVHDLYMTDTAKEAHYVLPACSNLEKYGVAYNYNVCHCIPYLMLRKKCIEPYEESWSEWKLFTELAKRLGLEEYFPWASEEELVAFELGRTGFSFDYLLNEKPEGDYYQQKSYTIPDGTFKTPSNKIEIYSDAMQQAGFDPLPTYLEPLKSPQSKKYKDAKKYPLILGTGNRSYYYTHSQHRNIDALNGQDPHPMAELSRNTAKDFGIKQGDDVSVSTDRGTVFMKASVVDCVADGIVFVPHGWSGQANANLLTDAKCREPILGYPDMKSLMCAIKSVEIR